MTKPTGTAFANVRLHRLSGSESVHEMQPPPSFPNPPQTAGDLLERLLRSELFADSISGQIIDHSVLHLGQPAAEFGAALVQKKVLTPWQESELLAGRSRFYAGTYRLLEKLTTAGGTALFIAEQSGPQRLVLLEITQLQAGAVWTPRPSVNRIETRHSNIAGCLDVQHTQALRIAAYDFIEALPLTSLSQGTPPERAQQADLLLQFTKAVIVLSDEVLVGIGPEKALIDRRGQLTLLAGPLAVEDSPSLSQSSSQRTTRQMAAVCRFAAFLGGLPEIVEYRSLDAVILHLFKCAETWADPWSDDSPNRTRSEMNRFLRRGPALRVIQAFGPKRQVVLTELVASSVASPQASGLPDEHAEVSLEPDASDSAPQFPEAGTGPHPDFVITAEPSAPDVPRPSVGEELVQLVRTERENRARLRQTPPVRPAQRGKVTAVLGLIAVGILATLWIERAGVRRARATSDRSSTSQQTSPPEHPTAEEDTPLSTPRSREPEPTAGD